MQLFSRKHLARRHLLRTPSPAPSRGATLRKIFRPLAASAAAAARRLAAFRKSAVGQDADSPDQSQVRGLIQMLLHIAASLRRVAAQLEREAQAAIRDASSARNGLPKLLDPRFVATGDLSLAIFEFGQPLTAREAFAIALGIAPEAVTAKLLGERKCLVPRRFAEHLVPGSGSELAIVFTQLEDRERAAIHLPGKGRLLREDRGTVTIHDGFASAFYLDGLAKMPVGSKIVLPALAVAS